MAIELVALVVALDVVMLAAACWQNLQLLSDDSEVPHRLRVFTLIATMLAFNLLIVVAVCTQAVRGDKLIRLLALAVPALCFSGKITQVLIDLQRKSRIQAVYDRGEG